MATSWLKAASILGVLLALLAVLSVSPTPHHHLARARLTPEGIPYQVVTSADQLTVMNIGSGTNNREIYWDDAMADTEAATQCAVWSSGTGIAQNGFAFRIAPHSGGYNAVVFVRNIFVNYYWMFEPKLFHTGTDYPPDDQTLSPQSDNGRGMWDSPDGVDLSGYLGMGHEAVYPLRVCVSLSSDDRMCFAVAKDGDTMPPLAHPGDRGGCWDLRMSDYYHDGEGLSGKNGMWAGHIPTGTSLDINDTILDGRPLPLG